MAGGGMEGETQVIGPGREVAQFGFETQRSAFQQATTGNPGAGYPITCLLLYPSVCGFSDY